MGFLSSSANYILSWTKTWVISLLLSTVYQTRSPWDIIPALLSASAFYLLTEGIVGLLTATTFRLQTGFSVFRCTVCWFLLVGLSLPTIWMWAAILYICAIGLIKSGIVRPFSVNDQGQNSDQLGVIRNNWRIGVRTFQPGSHRPDTHTVLAQERREMERIVFEYLIPKDAKIRQPGGNLNRHPDLSRRMHCCNRPFENKDFQRMASGNNTFQPRPRHRTCGYAGEHCPERNSIPYCVLSHVDYHCTPDQLSAMVTGPTYAIRHKMVDSHIGSHGDGHEASIRIIGDMCHMQVEGGQDYYHPYLDLGDCIGTTEGTVVGSSGGVSYYLVGNVGDTYLYYMFPHHGIYRQEKPELTYQNKQYRLIVGPDRNIVCYHKDDPPTDATECHLDRTEFDTLYNHFIWDPRIDGNLHTAYTYVDNRLQSHAEHFRYRSFLTEALLYLTVEDHFSCAGRSFRVETPWDLGWTLPFYQLCLRIDQKISGYNLDDMVGQIVDGRYHTWWATCFLFAFRTFIVFERKLNNFIELEPILPPPPPEPPSIVERAISNAVNGALQLLRAAVEPVPEPEPEPEAADDFVDENEGIESIREEHGTASGTRWVWEERVDRNQRPPERFSEIRVIYPNGDIRTQQSHLLVLGENIRNKIENILRNVPRNQQMGRLRVAMTNELNRITRESNELAVALSRGDN